MERTRAPRSCCPSDPNPGQKWGWQRLLGRTLNYSSPEAQEPKGGVDHREAGRGQRAGRQLCWAARPRPAWGSSDPPRDPPLGQHREPEAPARAPATGS